MSSCQEIASTPAVGIQLAFIVCQASRRPTALFDFSLSSHRETASTSGNALQLASGLPSHREIVSTPGDGLKLAFGLPSHREIVSTPGDGLQF